jgi:phosphoribosylanthranilate isomerase
VTVRTRFGLPVMKALPIAAREDISPIYLYAEVADWLLFDARAPRAASRPGGLGRPFDWRLLENLDPSLSFMLSGGLDAGNVAEALTITRAPAVDVSSGVERALGEKDPAKIRAFIQAARAAAAALGPLGPRNPGPKYYAPEDLGSQNKTPKDLGQKKNVGTV